VIVKQRQGLPRKSSAGNEAGWNEVLGWYAEHARKGLS